MTSVCNTCFHRCTLKEGQWGICRARKNENSEIVCKSYGIVSSLALDPIEKKPLYMFYPGSCILSVGSYGCNLRCPFCQNHEISMTGGEELLSFGAGFDSKSGASGDDYLSPKELSAIAEKYKERGNIGVAFTYNEPLVAWEYILDTAKLVKSKGMKNVLVTNGTASLDILERILPYIDAMNIDLKGFNDDFYKMVGGDFKTVKDFISRASGDCHIELTTLVIPHGNDNIDDMEREAKWIASVNKDIPLHITRFFPRYKMQDRAATDVRRIYELRDAAKKYLTNVFVGNC